MPEEMLSAIDNAIAVRRRSRPFETLTRMGFIREAIEREISNAGAAEVFADRPRRREAYRASEAGFTSAVEGQSGA